MPTESIVATLVVIGMFTFFSVVLGWASRMAPPTFPEDARGTVATPSAQGRNAPLGAH